MRTREPGSDIKRGPRRRALERGTGRIKLRLHKKRATSSSRALPAEPSTAKLAVKLLSRSFAIARFEFLFEKHVYNINLRLIL